MTTATLNSASLHETLQMITHWKTWYRPVLLLVSNEALRKYQQKISMMNKIRDEGKVIKWEDFHWLFDIVHLLGFVFVFFS